MFSWGKSLLVAATVAAGVFAFGSIADARPHRGFHVRPYAPYRPHVHLSPRVYGPYDGGFHLRPYAPYRPHVHLNPHVHRPSYRYGW